jgi:hypothetical protein
VEQSKSEVYHGLWMVIDAINNVPELAIGAFPVDDPVALTRLEEGFAAKSRKQAVRGCVGAIDGCIIHQKNPGLAVDNPARYHCARKDKFGMLLSASCNADREITWYDISASPSTHDHSAFRNTELGTLIYSGGLGDLFMLGDNAYVCGPNMVVPGDDDDFNYEQSMMRMNIECAFGELIHRWGIFWRALEMKFDRRAKVIGVALTLHNFCIRERMHVGAYTERWTPHGRHPGGIQRPPRMDRDDRPVEQLAATYTNSLGRGPPKDPREIRITTDSAVRSRLEAACRAKGLKRPRSHTSFNKNETGIV